MIKNILFDFDGVILDSMPTREIGFRKIFSQYDSKSVEKVIEFHNKNGGLSRFVKIKYFFEKILEQQISTVGIEKFAEKFSTIMKAELIKEEYLIKEVVQFIKENHKKYNMRIVSGSEHNELNFLCDKLGISQYFLSIEGSPTPKKILVERIIKKYKYSTEETCLIGDSINDFEAAETNNINFLGFNNIDLKEVSSQYIETFNEVKFT